MTPKTTLIAQFYNASFDRRGREEVADEQDAVRKGLHRHACLFETFEQTSVDINGKILTGEPQNLSGRRFIGIDTLYTVQDVIASYERDLANVNSIRDTFSRQIMRGVLKGMVRTYKKNDPDQIFIAEPGRPGDFIGLKPGEKAFDRSGTQIWPKLEP